MYKYLLLDPDGTLTDPGIGITNSVMYALGKFGINADDRTALYKFIGPPLKESFAKYYGFSAEQCGLAVRYYREYFTERCENHKPINKGVNFIRYEKAFY